MGNSAGSAGCTYIHIYMALFSLSLWCSAHFNDEIKAIFKLHLQSRSGSTQSAALSPKWTTGEFLWSKQLNASQRLAFHHINQAFSCGHWLLPCRYMWMKNWAMQLCSRKSVLRRKITRGRHSSAPGGSFVSVSGTLPGILFVLLSWCRCWDISSSIPVFLIIHKSLWSSEGSLMRGQIGSGQTTGGSASS